MIYIRRYNQKDWPLIARWAKKHGVEFEQPHRLPKYGFVAVTEFNGPIACGFLLRREKNVPIAEIEYFVSNPDCAEELRNASYPHLFKAIEEKAISLGYEKIIASTAIMKVAQLAKANGMTIDPMPYLFVRKLLQKGECINERGSGSERAECASR